MWDEEKVSIVFSNALYFEFDSGSYISDIYKVISNAAIVNEALIREYGKVPKNHDRQLIVIEDIEKHLISKIACSKFIISK